MPVPSIKSCAGSLRDLAACVHEMFEANRHIYNLLQTMHTSLVRSYEEFSDLNLDMEKYDIQEKNVMKVVEVMSELNDIKNKSDALRTNQSSSSYHIEDISHGISLIALQLTQLKTEFTKACGKEE
jgi:hypothetical protein